jgi:hypothetical protein
MKANMGITMKKILVGTFNIQRARNANKTLIHNRIDVIRNRIRIIIKNSRWIRITLYVMVGLWTLAPTCHDKAFK